MKSVNREVLLTIGIPTFNRANYLRDLLEHLLAQIMVCNDLQAEILVCDNCSEDETESVCREYVLQCPSIVSYMRHKENIGFDANVDSLFNSARGQYVLLHGDDDLPLPGAIDHIRDIICTPSRDSPQVIFCNHELVNYKTGASVNIMEDFYIRPLDIVGNTVLYKSGIAFLRQHMAPLYGGLTGTVILRSAWITSERNSYMGTNFIQLAVAYQIVVCNPMCIVYSPKFIVRMNTPHSWPLHGELFFGLLKASRPIAELYPPDIVIWLRRSKDWAVRKAIILYRANSPRDRDLTQMILNSLDKNTIGYWFFDLPLIWLPRIICKLIFKARLYFENH